MSQRILEISISTHQILRPVYARKTEHGTQNRNDSGATVSKGSGDEFVSRAVYGDDMFRSGWILFDILPEFDDEIVHGA